MDIDLTKNLETVQQSKHAQALFGGEPSIFYDFNDCNFAQFGDNERVIM